MTGAKTDQPQGATSHHHAMDIPTRTKIIATVGPASESIEMLERMIEWGVTCFRLNFSHGTFHEHHRRLLNIRAAADELGVPVGVLGDLQGPKIRIGQVPDGGIVVHAGQDMVIRRDIDMAHLEGDLPVFGTTYEPMIDEVKPGQRVLINDGSIRMLAVESDRDELRCRVIHGGPVTSSKGINLPETDMNAPAITERDWECVKWAVEHDLDFLALSFVRRAEEILDLKAKLKGMCAVDRDLADPTGATIPIVAKIEKPQAVANLSEIVAAADAVMIARGDLGVEMDIARVPVVARQILKECQDWGKPCIIATQMLETMTDNAIPTRAEATDVATAVFAQADVVMLSGETAVGKHPDLVCETMSRILHESEAARREILPAANPPSRLVDSRYRTAALAHGAWHVAKDLDASMVVCWSQSGNTARFLSQNNFRVPILAWTSSARAARRMAMLSNVFAVCEDPPETGALRDWTDSVERFIIEHNWAKQGDTVVMLAGKPIGVPKSTDSIAVLGIGDPTSGYRGYRSVEEGAD